MGGRAPEAHVIPTTPINMSDWYYSQNETVFGPFDLPSLKQMHQAGVLTADTLVAQQGSEQWMPLSEVPLTTADHTTREFPVNLGWRTLPGLIQIKQSNTGLFGNGTACILGDQIVLKGYKLWSMWLRVLSFFVIMFLVFLGVTLTAGIAAYAGLLPAAPSDSSLAGSVEMAVGIEAACFFFFVLPVLIAAVVAEGFLVKRADHQYRVLSTPKVGRTGTSVKIDVMANVKHRITLRFKNRHLAEEFIGISAL